MTGMAIVESGVVLAMWASAIGADAYVVSDVRVDGAVIFSLRSTHQELQCS